MKSIRAFMVGLTLAVCLPAVTVSAAATQDPYREAVASYVGAAEQELQAMRDQHAALGSAASPERQQSLSVVAPRLEEAGRLIGELRDATPDRFDALKLRYEKIRTEIVASLQAAAKVR